MMGRMTFLLFIVSALLLLTPAQALPALDSRDSRDPLDSLLLIQKATDLQLTEHAPASASPTGVPSTEADKCRPETIDMSAAHESKIPALGVSIEILSCVFSNVGLVTEKMALLKEEKRLGNAADVQSFKLPMWWLGFVSFATGQILSGVALTLMSVVVVTPLGSFTVIVNLFTSYFVMHEKSGILQVLCSLLIVIGCVMTTVFAPWVKASSSLECFRVYVGNPDFHMVAGILLGTFVPVLLISRALVLPSQNTTSDQTKWPTTARVGKWMYPVAAGLISVWTVNVGSSLMRLLSEAMGGHAAEVMESYEIYVVLAVYLCAIVLWQNLMNACMIVLDACFVIPIHFALFTMLTLPLSGSLHNTLSDWHPEPAPLAAYLVGMTLNVAGMFGLLLLGSRGGTDEIVHMKETSEADTSKLLDKESSTMVSMAPASRPAASFAPTAPTASDSAEL